MFYRKFLQLFTGSKKYCDYASITPTDAKVSKSMRMYENRFFFNPSSIYMDGVKNRNVIDSSRKVISKFLKARSADVYFTGSGTESNNIFLLGLFRHAVEDLGIESPHFITSTIEHPAISEVCEHIKSHGGTVTYIPVNEKGVVNPADVLNAVTDSTVGISIMYVNNEIGSVMPITEIGRKLKKMKIDDGKTFGDMPYFHTDASQAGAYQNLDCERLGVHSMTLDGSKIYGPKGVGILYKHHQLHLRSVLFGGGQEEGLRPGTENVPGIVGITHALQLVQGRKKTESVRLLKLTDELIDSIQKEIPNAQINSDENVRSPHIVNICIPNLNAEFAVIQLDERGVQCASMTACKNLHDDSASFVLQAIGRDECAESSLRFSFGKSSKLSDVTKIVTAVKEVVREQGI